MSQWKNTDDAANSVLWAVEQYKVKANSTTQAAFYGNTTADAFITGVTVGQFAVDDNEIKADGGKVAHTGWVVRTVGSGGRANRILSEVLVAGGITTDGEDVVYPDYNITITTQPSSTTIDASANADNTGTFSVVATSTPPTTLSYLWQANTGSGFVNAAAGTTGNTTTTLTVFANTFTTGDQFRVLVSATGATPVTSSAANVTITT